MKDIQRNVSSSRRSKSGSSWYKTSLNRADLAPIWLLRLEPRVQHYEKRFCKQGAGTVLVVVATFPALTAVAAAVVAVSSRFTLHSSESTPYMLFSHSLLSPLPARKSGRST